MAYVSRRSLIIAALSAGVLQASALLAADKPMEIRLDWATYNPVSMVLREKGWLEKEFAKDNISVRWVQTLGSNKALEFLNAGSIDFGSTAGSAALVAKINGNPIKSIYVYSRPEWTALVVRKNSPINAVADLKGKRVAVTRGTDPHIFLVRALLDVGLSEKDIAPVLLQHPDGKTALVRGDVDAWAGLDPMMAQAEIEDGARLFFRNPGANTWGILNVREEFLRDRPDLVRRVLAVYEEALRCRSGSHSCGSLRCAPGGPTAGWFRRLRGCSKRLQIWGAAASSPGIPSRRCSGWRPASVSASPPPRCSVQLRAIRRWRSRCSTRRCRRCVRFRQSHGCRCSSCGWVFSKPQRWR
jgi:sulfonate transport system substrate-binding protein